jgi:hypothetical protein
MHKIVFRMRSNKLAELPWPYGLESARIYARNNIMIYNATHAEIVNASTNAVLFTYLGQSPRRHEKESNRISTNPGHGVSLV